MKERRFMLVLKATVITRGEVRTVVEEHTETLLGERTSEQDITVTNVKVELLPLSALRVKNCGERDEVVECYQEKDAYWRTEKTG